MTVTPAWRVQCSGPCRRWLSLPDGYQPGEDIPLAALVPQPTAERAGMWPTETDARRAAFCAGWSGGRCPDCAVDRAARRDDEHLCELPDPNREGYWCGKRIGHRDECDYRQVDTEGGAL